jgi:hypothetical protein
VAVTFEHFDLASVGVLDEVVAGDQHAVVGVEFAQVVRRETQFEQPLPIRLRIVDDERDVALAGAVRVGLGAPLVPGEFDFRVCFVVA